MQEPTLFTNLYMLEERWPRYESPSSKVYFVKYYGINGSSELTLTKFVYNQSNLQAELDARHSEDGKYRFGNDYMIASLYYHDDPDTVFSKITTAIGLPCYCFVMERGDFKLVCRLFSILGQMLNNIYLKKAE